MVKVFGWSAGLWVVGMLLLVGIAAHVALAHWFTLLWATVLLVGAPFAWRWFASYKATAEVALRIDAAEGRLWKVVSLHLEGAKSAVLMLFASGWLTAKDWVDSTVHGVFGLTPSDLDPFRVSTVLHTFLADGTASKILAGISLLAAFLTVHGKLFAARLTPAPGSPPAAT